MTSRAVDTPTPPDPTDDPRLTPLYFINPNVREDAYNRGVMDAARALATPDPSIPERPDPPTYRDERLRDWTAGYDAGLRTALGSIPERPAEPRQDATVALAAALQDQYEDEIGDMEFALWETDAAKLIAAVPWLRAALAQQSTPESRDE